MSLYCFGKLIPATGKTIVLPTSNHLFQKIDSDDAETIDAIPDLTATGIYFSLADTKNSNDASGLWSFAEKKSLSELPHTPLGICVNSLLNNPDISVGSIAFIDGGIESILSGSAAECWSWFTERTRKPWDSIDNPLFIWKRAIF